MASQRQEWRQEHWYCSDNGGHAGPNSTGNLRGSKGTMWEGGLRVPGIVEWPARIARPFVSATPCSTLDIYPTDLAAQEPARVANMTAALEAWKASVEKSLAGADYAVAAGR